MMNTPLDTAIAVAGLGKLAARLDVTYHSLRKWQKQGRLPRTELSGESDYAQKIEQATGGKVTAIELIEWSFPERWRGAA